MASQNILDQIIREAIDLNAAYIPNTSENLKRSADKQTKELKSPSKKKRLSSNNKNNNESSRADEAYLIMKNLESKQNRDRFSIFGEHVANKIRMLKIENAQHMVEHIISTTLWEAAMGKYDQPLFLGYQNVTSEPPHASSSSYQHPSHSITQSSNYASSEGSNLRYEALQNINQEQ